MAWIGTVISALLLVVIDRDQEGIGELILTPISAVFGFIPLFMYGAWLGSQIKGAV